MNNKDNVVIVGITGGIGSGKSTIAQWIRERGYPVISSDELARKIMVESEVVKKELIGKFGDNIFLQSGELNKELLRKLIFDAENPQVNTVNQIVHPHTIDAIVNSLEKMADNNEKLIFVESALMYESGMADGYDYIICVYTDEDKAAERVKNRSQLNDDVIRVIKKSQLNPIEKKKRADFVLYNNGTIDELRSAFEALFPIIENLPPNRNED